MNIEKNAESFYVCNSYTKANGRTTSAIVRKLGTLEQLLSEHGPTRDDVVAWAKNEVKLETEKYKKEKEAQTVLIPFHADRQFIQMGLFMDGDGIPLAFSLFPGNANEQTSLKPLEKKVLGDFGCQKFIYCSDAGLGSESIREYNHMGERSYIVTQSIKKLKKEEKEWALNLQGFKRVSDGTPVDITKLPEDDKGLYYKDEPYTTKKLHQRLIITYSPKYALYQKSIRDKQIERAQKMLDLGSTKKNQKKQMTQHVSSELWL